MSIIFKSAELPPPAGARLGTAVARGGLVTVAGSWTRFALQFATTVVVARLLGPEQYGVAAVVLVFSTLAEAVRSSGLANAVIQRPDLDHRIARSALVVSSTAGAVLGLVAAGVAAVVHLPGVEAWSALALGTLPALAGAGAIPAALLARELAFLRLASLELAAAAAGSAVAVALAVSGAGGASLVLQALTTGAVLSAGGLAMTRLPGAGFASRRRLRPYLAFAGHSAIGQGARFVSQNADRVAVSAIGGAGPYAQAAQLITLPVAQITVPVQRVVLPALSRVADDPTRFRRYYRVATAVLGLTILPLLAGLVAVASPLVQTLFGAAWSASVPLFRLLAAAGAASMLVYVNSWVFVATGRVRIQARLTVATSAVTVAAVAIAAAGASPASTGAALVAVAVTVSTGITALTGFAVSRRETALTAGDLIVPLAPGAAAAVVVAGCAWGAASAPVPAALQLAAGCCAGALGYAVVVAVLPAARRTVADVARLLRAGRVPRTTARTTRTGTDREPA